MTPFAILAPPRILFGRGQSAQAASAVAGFGARPFLVHGRDGTRAAWLIAALRAKGLTVTPFACPYEPDRPGLESAVATARSIGADCVVALGGGAAIDLGKAVAALLPASGGPLDHLEVVGRGLPLVEAPLPFIALPTTAGTGAEVTKNAVIDVPSHRRKVSIRDDRMIAQLAIIDPALTDQTPRAVTLASGLDAITQVIEPYLCTRANAYTDALCHKAIPLGLAALRRLMQGEDPQARDQMAWVSLSGGLALANSGLGAVHGFAGAIGGVTGAPHGAICGALLPHVLRMNAAHAPSARMDEVQRWLAQSFGAKDGIAALQSWSHDHGLPDLLALGIKPEDHPAVCAAALEASSMKANPFMPGLSDLSGVLAAS